jgi:RNA-directed DNA polymerase
MPFNDNFSDNVLLEVFETSVKASGGRGVDRIGVEVFEERKLDHLAVASRKIQAGTYRFSPYYEKLVLKGRGKTPRILSRPTVRDKVVLSAMKRSLHQALGAEAKQALPNAFVRRLKRFLWSELDEDAVLFRLDISQFYDCVIHGQLLDLLSSRGCDGQLVQMVRRAIRTPTVSDGHARRLRSKRNLVGVPQGLAISNLLANVYLTDFDRIVADESLLYMRYVDDMLVVVQADNVDSVRSLIDDKLDELGLALNQEKSRILGMLDYFEYLGYSFQAENVGVRKSSQARFIASLAAMFAQFKHRARNPQRPTWLSDDLTRQALVEDVNERITGAISGNRRYGWLFYYSEINDFTMLHQIDATIAGFFQSCPGWGFEPADLKKLSRAYFEIRSDLTGGYIHDYNSYVTPVAKLNFLSRRALIDPQRVDEVTVEEIESLFARERAYRLGRLELDVGTIS